MIHYETRDSLEDRFEEAATRVRKLKMRPTDQELLMLYGLYKQAKDGNYDSVNYPPFYQVKERAKWDSWRSNSGMSRSRAMSQYIKVVDELVQKYGGI